MVNGIRGMAVRVVSFMISIYKIRLILLQSVQTKIILNNTSERGGEWELLSGLIVAVF